MTEGQSPVVLLDVNVLVALALANHVHHRTAHEALRRTRSWATTPITESAMFRLLTNPVVAGVALSARDVGQIVSDMRSQPGWRFLHDGSSLVTPAIDLSVLVGHRQVTDFHLVNVAATHDAVLGTFDAALVASLAPSDRRHVWLIEPSGN